MCVFHAEIISWKYFNLITDLFWKYEFEVGYGIVYEE